jgi:hypothetical protein
MFLQFAQTHIKGGRPEAWQTAEFCGDKLFADTVSRVLWEWPLYGPFVRLVFQALTSNAYCRLLALEFHLLELCIGAKGQEIAVTFGGSKGPADVFEVHLFPSLWPLFCLRSSCRRYSITLSN